MTETSPPPPPPAKNGSVVVGAGVAGVATVLALVTAMVQPMNQRVDTQNAYISELKEEISRMQDRERLTSQVMATMSEARKEVETQFRLFQQVNGAKFVELERRVTKSETDGNPRHDERIKNLERVNGFVKTAAK